MKITYDEKRDLLYIYLKKEGIKVAKTETIAPGIFIDFDAEGKPMGIEILDASEIIEKEISIPLVPVYIQK